MKQPAITLVFLVFVQYALGSSTCFAFCVPHYNAARSLTNLHGIAEWRQNTLSNSDKRPISLLTLPTDDALTLGQSCQLVLKEGRFFDMLQECLDDRDGVVGVALVGPDGLLPRLVLCEIVEFEANAGFRGKLTVTITLKAVGRGTLTHLTQMKPHMAGVCQDFADRPSRRDMETARGLLEEIEALVESLGDSEMYDAEYQRVLGVVVPSHESPSNDCRSAEEVSAASWAISSIALGKDDRLEAITTDNVASRLQLGLKVLQQKQGRSISQKMFQASTHSEPSMAEGAFE